MHKDQTTLQRESSEGSFKRASTLSANAQKRMSKKLKGQANKMRGAMNKANAIAAIADVPNDGIADNEDIIVEEKKDSPGKAGYG